MKNQTINQYVIQKRGKELISKHDSLDSKTISESKQKSLKRS